MIIERAHLIQLIVININNYKHKNWDIVISLGLLAALLACCLVLEQLGDFLAFYPNLGHEVPQLCRVFL